MNSGKGYTIRPMTAAEYAALGLKKPRPRKHKRPPQTRPLTREECERYGIAWLPEYERA